MTPDVDYGKILRKYKADPASLLKAMSDLEERARNGVEQEKVSVKDGVVQVTERYPNVELQVLKLKWEMWQALSPKQEGQLSLDLRIVDMTSNE